MNERLPKNAGFSTLEVVLAASLLVIVGYRAAAVFHAASKETGSDTSQVVLENKAHALLERIATAVMGSSRDSLDPDSEAPLANDRMRYQIYLGIEGGDVVWSEPEEIGLEEQNRSRLYYSRNPGADDEARVAWTNLVRPFLEGELPNGMDDNGNGLIDERGLNFDVDRNAVTIRLTLERTDSQGESMTHTVQTTVTCRNLVPSLEEGVL